MISRAARVPRICLACRFGLITQRSAGLGFRPNPVREGLGRRSYTSEIGNTRDGKADPFITNSNTSETRAKEVGVEEEPRESPTESKDATSTTNSPSTAETDSGSTRPSEEPQLDIDLNLDPVPNSTAASTSELSPEKPVDSGPTELDDLVNESSPPPPRKPNYGITDLPELSELSSKQSSESDQFDLDDLIGGPAKRKAENAEFEMSELPELGDDIERSRDGFRDDSMTLPKSRFRDLLMHDESLGVSTLGLPADAIIINNPNRTRIERPAPTIINAEPMDNTKVDWEKLVLDENAEPGTDEIMANIEELRPDSRILRLADIDKLLEALCNGFTITQLREYHKARKPESKDPDFVDYHWISESIPWTSVNSFQLRGNDKTTIAQKIVFDKWKIEVQEHADDLGKAFIWMAPNIFPFLTYGPNNIGRLLWELRRDFLVGEDEKLTLHTPKCRLNITAKKSTAYGILAHINQAVERMKSRVINITPYLSKASSNLKTSELKELGRLTKTSIESFREGNQEKFLVSWMPKSSETPTETEDVADTVFRLLVGRVVPGSHNFLQCIPSQGEDEISGQLVQVQRHSRAMSWRDKLNKWLRVVAPIEKSTQPSPLNLTASASLPESKVPLTGNKDATTATFGHILHPEAGTSIKSLFRKRRILAPLIPHPAAFSALKPDDDQPLKETTTIVMHLVPHIDGNKGRSGATKKSVEDPAVCIRIPVHPDADLTNFEIPKDMTAECYVPWHVNDVLLPTEAVDVRLEHKRSFALKVVHPGLKKFLETSQLNLLEGELRTPSQATLSIPGSWINGSRSGNSNTKKRDVLYEFRGTEIHQTVEMPWRGHTLRYSSIEAGQHGGQRQEITLQAGTPDEDRVAFQGERRETFLQLVEDMATGKYFSWSEGYKSIKNRQLEDYSYNLPEEELTEDIIVDKDKFDSRGRVRQPENKRLKRERKEKEKREKEEKEKKQSSPQPPEAGTFDDIDAMLAAENGPTPEIETDNMSKPDYDVPIVEGGNTHELIKFLDKYARPKAFLDENNNQVYGVDAASRYNSASEETRQEVLNEYFTIPEPSPAPEKPAAKKPAPKQTNKSKSKSIKYTLPDLPEKPKSQKAVDPFAAQFASRVTAKNRVADPGAATGFFGDLPPEPKEKGGKRIWYQRTRNGGRRGAGGARKR
ncbi:hypothetical protein F53441_10922 [Fusarium austroafricanum]|uniref:Uncharacterized protein n=1 Tax=Fusarium austroafricanum TaxID=2364996 RepID=A0A8H4K7U5_9HYPO|nr:hypothetical protein F53441_10922 [Fusarium austroafricanum]